MKLSWINFIPFSPHDHSTSWLSRGNYHHNCVCLISLCFYTLFHIYVVTIKTLHISNFHKWYHVESFTICFLNSTLYFWDPLMLINVNCNNIPHFICPFLFWYHLFLIFHYYKLFYNMQLYIYRYEMCRTFSRIYAYE